MPLPSETIDLIHSMKFFLDNPPGDMDGKSIKTLREACVSVLKHAVKLEPDNVDFLTRLGSEMTTLRNFDEAVPHLEKALRSEPDNLQALSFLGRALQLDPDSAEKNSHLGFALDKLGHGEEAISYHRKAVQLEPEGTGRQIFLIHALYELGRYEEALKALESARTIDHDPTFDTNFLRYEALAHEKLGDREKAVRLLRESFMAAAIQENTDGLSILSIQCQVENDLVRLGEPRPEYAYEKLVTAANEYDVTKNYAEALERFEKIRAMPHGPKFDIQILSLMSTVHAESGNKAEAIRVLQEALDSVKPLNDPELENNIRKAIAELEEAPPAPPTLENAPASP